VKRATWLWLALGLAGCGGAECAELADGSYLLSMDRRSGTCVDYFEQVVIFGGVGGGGGPEPGDEGCYVEDELYEACGESWVMVCDVYNDVSGAYEGQITMSMSLDYTSAGTADGISSVEVQRVSGSSCTSTYDVAISRL
jgi:hypothetical protein